MYTRKCGCVWTFGSGCALACDSEDLYVCAMCVCACPYTHTYKHTHIHVYPRILYTYTFTPHCHN